MYPKARLDALTDGIFGVAMTLLVLDLRLPDDFQPRDARDLVEALAGLAPKVLPYVLSFAVLGLRWLSGIRLRPRGESVGTAFVGWWLLYLLSVTCIPLVTIVVGRFPALPPAIWLYAGNTLLMTTAGAFTIALTPGVEPAERHDHQMLAKVLIASSGLAIACSFLYPGLALWPYGIGMVLLFVSWRRNHHA